MSLLYIFIYLCAISAYCLIFVLLCRIFAPYYNVLRIVEFFTFIHIFDIASLCYFMRNKLIMMTMMTVIIIVVIIIVIIFIIPHVCIQSSTLMTAQSTASSNCRRLDSAEGNIYQFDGGRRYGQR